MRGRIGYAKRKRGIVARTVELAPSILSANFANLAVEAKLALEGGGTLLHVDVMDGHFVPNITIGPPVVRSLRKAIPDAIFDVHLMIENPDQYIPAFAEAGATWILVHQEACVHLDRTLNLIRSSGAEAGVVINPATPVETLCEALDIVDYVLVMSVNPGFGGQQFIPGALQKIRKLRDLIASYGCRARIEVDGGIGPANLEDVLVAGAEIIVAGSAVFNGPSDVSSAVREMREIAERVLERAAPVAE